MEKSNFVPIPPDYRLDMEKWDFFLLQLVYPILTSFRHSKCIPDIDTTNLLSLKYKMRFHLTYQTYFCAFGEFIKVPFNRIISTLSAIDWNICCITLNKYPNTMKKSSASIAIVRVFFCSLENDAQTISCSNEDRW